MVNNRRQKEGGEAQVPMSPMIDVVFLLLIYFIVTYQAEIPTAHLAVKLPGAPEQQQEEQQEPPTLLELEVHPGVYTLRGKKHSLNTIRDALSSIAESDPEVTAIIKVNVRTETRRLIHLLDICRGVGLQNLNVVTLK